MVARHLQITGRVQGVGFRYSMQHEAARLGVHGWVRNRADGSLEAVLQGDAPAVARLITWARQGPPLAQVLALDEQAADRDFERTYHSFERWPTA